MEDTRWVAGGLGDVEGWSERVGGGLGLGVGGWALLRCTGALGGGMSRGCRKVIHATPLDMILRIAGIHPISDQKQTYWHNEGLHEGLIDSFSKIPEGVDVLLTHSPPYGHGQGAQQLSIALRTAHGLIR